jgi:MoaA/NifB/PqqE/SkfB family radical SAM enzyme
LNSITSLRKLNFSNDLRGKYIQFVQYIHDKVRRGDVRQLTSPLSVYWSITRKCNLRCKHCYAADELCQTSEDISLEHAKKIVDRLKELNIAELILQGGEPACYTNIIQLILYIKQKDIPITLITNGTLITGLLLECIQNNFSDLDLMQISLDGTEDTCDAIRGKNTYSKIMKLFSILKCNIVINCVITKENLHDIPFLCEHLSIFPNIRSLHFSPSFKIGNGVKVESPEPEEVLPIFQDLKERYGNWISGTMIPDSYFLLNKNAPVIDMEHVVLGCCAGRSKMYINSDGIAFSCDFCQSKVGFNVLDEEFLKKWQTQWSNQIDRAMGISLKMKETGRMLSFCPNMEK